MKTRTALAIAATICLAAPLQAQAANPTLAHCQTNALNELRRTNPGADSVRLEANPVVRMALNHGGEISGKGSFFDWSSRRTQRFTYICDYKVQTAQARVVVRLDPAR